MAVIETWRRRDLSSLTEIEYLQGNLFSQDAAGNLIGVELYQDGAAYAGGGSVSANVIRADGATVAVTGSISGNRASVTLPAACYAVVGPIIIVVKRTVGSAVTTIGAFASSVYASTTSATVDPGTLVNSVQTLISAIEAAMEEIPVGYNASFAPAYSTSSAYAVGDCVTYDGKLYRCKTAITSGESWTSGHWVQTDVTGATMLYRGSFSANTDLNDVRTAGMYNMPAGYTYTNAPSGISSASSMFVIGSTSYHMQIIVNNPLHGIYYRYCQNGTYGGWRMLPHGVAEYSSADDLNNLDDTQIVFYPSSSVPAHAPLDGVGGVVMNFRYNTTYRIQIYTNSRNDFYFRMNAQAGYTAWKNLSRPKDILDFTVVKGAWNRKGSIGVSGVKGVCCDHKFELTPGSALDFYLAPGWTYTIREGNTATNLSMTAHLSKARTHIVSFPYVAITFNKFDSNGDAINLTVGDFDDSVIVHTSGDAQGSVTVNDYHDFPENAGQLNVIYRAYQMSQLSYTAKAKLYLHSGGSVESTEVIEDVEAGTELDGVPYSSMRETMASIPQATSFHAFMTMVENANSYLYTKHYEPVSPGYDYNSRCYVGAVCSSLVAYCYGIDDVIPTTISFAHYSGMNQLPESQQNPQSLKLADMLNKAGEHIVIVTDIIRTDRGKVKAIEVTEAWKPLCRTKTYTPAQIISRYFDNGFVAYRYENVDEVTYTPDPWIHIDDTETGTPEYNSVLSPRKGEKSNWGVGETVEIDVLDNTAGYTSYVLKNVASGSVVSTASIPAGNVIRLTSLSEGRYSVHLTDGTNTSDPVLFDVIDADPDYHVKSEAYPDLGYHQVLVEFESAANRIPSAVYWCCNKQSSADYKAVLDYHVLTAAEVTAGKATIDEPTEYRSQYSDSGVWKMRVCYKTEFGLFASPLVDVNVPAGS